MNSSLTGGSKQNWFENNPKKSLLLILFIFLAVIELLLRLFFPPNLVDQNNIVPNKLYFKNYDANIEFVTYPGKYDSFKPVTNKINSIGIRGPELEAKNKYRVVNIGDSFVQADEVSFENTFGEHLNNSTLDIEFISHGIASWSPTPEFSWIYHHADELKFDEVNLFLCVNDFFRKSAYQSIDQIYRAHANYSENGIPVTYNIAPSEMTIRDMMRGFYIYKLLSFAKTKIIETFNENRATNSGTLPESISVASEIIMLSNNSEVWDDELKNNVLETLNVVRKADVFLKNKNIKLNVLFVPLGLAWEDEFRCGKKALSRDWGESKIITQKGIESFAKEFFQSHDINYIELSKEFDKFKNENKDVTLFYENDGHWTKDGHFLVYKILYNHYYSIKNSTDNY